MKSISYYQAAIFLSSDFFSKYWSDIAGYTFSKENIEHVKIVFREVVLKFMAGEDIFWNIDFSEDNINIIEDFGTNLIEKKLNPILSPLKLIINRFDENNIEIDMVLNFFHRVAVDFEFCIEEKISVHTHEYLNLCMGETKGNQINTLGLYDAWQHSESEWDYYIRNITPDLPNYICDIFLDIYEYNNDMLSAVYQTLSELVSKEEKNNILYELKQAMLNYYSSETIVDQAVKLIPVNTS